MRLYQISPCGRLLLAASASEHVWVGRRAATVEMAVYGPEDGPNRPNVSAPVCGSRERSLPLSRPSQRPCRSGATVSTDSERTPSINGGSPASSRRPITGEAAGEGPDLERLHACLGNCLYLVSPCGTRTRGGCNSGGLYWRFAQIRQGGKGTPDGVRLASAPWSARGSPRPALTG